MNLSDSEAISLGWGVVYGLVYLGCVGFALRMALLESRSREDREQ